ncbi:MAG: transposase [Ulvibacter sp.]|jgi:transposase
MIGTANSSFCRTYKKWKNSQNITLRQKHKAGEKLFIDYSGKKAKIFDKNSNSYQEAKISIKFIGLEII